MRTGQAASAPARDSGPLPDAPTRLGATVINNNELTLSWTEPTGGGRATSWIIEAGSAPGLSDVATVPGGARFFASIVVWSMSGVPAGRYYVRVRAQNAAGVSGPSNEVLVTIRESCGGTPGQPTGLVASVSGSTVTLTWGAGPGCPPSAYIVWAGSYPGGDDLAVIATDGPVTSYVARNVRSGTYYVRVSAGGGDRSNEVVVSVR